MNNTFIDEYGKTQTILGHSAVVPNYVDVQNEEGALRVRPIGLVNAAGLDVPVNEGENNAV